MLILLILVFLQNDFFHHCRTEQLEKLAAASKRHNFSRDELRLDRWNPPSCNLCRSRMRSSNQHRFTGDTGGIDSLETLQAFLKNLEHWSFVATSTYWTWVYHIATKPTNNHKKRKPITTALLPSWKRKTEDLEKEEGEYCLF